MEASRLDGSVKGVYGIRGSLRDKKESEGL